MFKEENVFYLLAFNGMFLCLCFDTCVCNPPPFFFLDKRILLLILFITCFHLNFLIS